MARKKRKLTQKQLNALAKGRAMRKSKRLYSSKTTTKVVRVQKVARKKYKRKATSSKSKSRGIFANVSGILGAVAYGAVREKASTWISNTPLGKQLPVTIFTDEAVMLAINFGARKIGLGKNPIGNSILKAQKTVELARVGQGIVYMMAQKNLNNGMNTNQNGLVMLS